MAFFRYNSLLLYFYLGSAQIHPRQASMKEYTLLSVFSVALVLIADVFLKTNLLKRKLFWFFLLVIIFFKFIVNGYLTGKNIVIYNPEFFMGLRIGSIPAEDFIFGFSMVSLSIIFWEYFKRQKT